MSARRNPKLSGEEMLRARDRARRPQSYAEEATFLQLCGYYPDDPEARSLYRAACEKWGAREELRKLEREWDRRERFPGPQLYTGGKGAPVDFTGAAQDQVEEARERIHRDFDVLPRLPWSSLHRAVGHGFLPEQFWTVAASSGHGKTTFAMTLVEAWLQEKRRIFMLPLEQGTDTTRAYLAALAHNLPVRLVLKNAWRELPPLAQAQVEQHLLWQAEEGATLLHLHPEGRVTHKQLPALYKRAADFGAELFIIDHLHRVAVRGWDEFADLCATVKELAKHYRIPALGMAQMNRGQGPLDRLRSFMVPAVDSIQSGKVLEQESDVVLGLYRPLRDGLDAETLAQLRRGQLAVRDFLKPSTVGVALLKNRIEGEIGAVVDLQWERGRIIDPEDEAAKQIEERYDV